MHRWYRLTDRWVERRERVARRWYRLTDRAASRAERSRFRWYRFTDRWTDRRDRITRRWYRFTDRGTSRAERVRLGWYRFTDRWDDRIADRRDADRRSIFGFGAITILAVATGVAALAILAAVVLANDPERAVNAGRDAAPVPSIGISVPDVRGDTASDARRALIDAGLTLEGVEAAVGAPGRVIDISPAVGRLVEPETPVILIIGVEADRASAMRPDDP